MPRDRTTNKAAHAPIAALVMAGLALYAIAAWIQHAWPASRPGSIAVRLLALALLAAAAARRRSLTGWIFFAMLAGIEFGIDAPHAALASRVLSDIFLRLIKVIVAPLILGTLVTGIAGHGSLKGVGRIGLKSLVFFEVVTTIALVIGVIAIAGLPPFGVFTSEFLVLTTSFARAPLLALLLLAGLLVGFGALMLRLQGLAFGVGEGGGKARSAALLPLFLHFALVLCAGIYLPGPLVAWFHTVAQLLG